MKFSGPQKTNSTIRAKPALSLITLATPESRLGVWALLTVAIWAAPFTWLTNLSLYGHLGWHSAPSIGLTRAYWLILHGKLTDGWRMNHIIVAILFIGIPLLAIDGFKLMKHKTRS